MAWSLAANLQGPAGPSAVSADAGNSARLGTDAKVFVPSSLYVLPVATAKVLGGIKVGAGLSMTADGVLSAAMATTYVNKAGDVMNGPLRWANSGGVSTFNGRDVYLLAFSSRPSLSRSICAAARSSAGSAQSWICPMSPTSSAGFGALL